jgi:hypothetical protein
MLKMRDLKATSTVKDSQTRVCSLLPTKDKSKQRQRLLWLALKKKIKFL